MSNVNPNQQLPGMPPIINIPAQSGSLGLGLGFGSGNTTAQSIPGIPNDKVTGGVVLILMVLVIAILAGVSEGMGKVLVVVMGGFLLAWALTSGGQNDLRKWIGLSQIGNPRTGRGVTIV